MDLHDTVDLFSTEVFTDAFDSTTSFTGKLNPFAEVTNSGAASRRRILEIPRDQVIPTPRVVISPSGQNLIVADSNTDYWNGEIIRFKYPTYPVTSYGVVGSIGQIMAGTPYDTQAYAYTFYMGSEANIDERADYLSRFELYFPKVNTYNRGEILFVDGNYFRLKSDTSVDGAGFGVALGVKLEDPVQSLDVIVHGTTFDPVTDSYTSTPTEDVVCFVEPLNQEYEFVTPSFTKIEVGDKAISILKATLTPAVNDRVGAYKVLSIREFTDYVVCQCRNMGDLSTAVIADISTYLLDDTDGASLVEDSDSTILFIDD